MHTTKLKSCTLLHDGEYDGPMYLRPAGMPEDRGIIVTRKMLTDALRAQPDVAVVTLRGPKECEHDRHDPETEPGAGAIKPGPWIDGEVSAARKDIETILFWYYTTRIHLLAGELCLPDLPFDQLIQDLDSMGCELEAIGSTSTR